MLYIGSLINLTPQAMTDEGLTGQYVIPAMYDHHGKLSRLDGGNLLVIHSMRPHSVQLPLYIE